MTMELPIFNDKLKSSGSWTETLAQARAAWSTAALPKARDLQLAAFHQRTPALEEARLLRAAELITTWAQAATLQRFTRKELLTLHQTLMGAAADANGLRQTEPSPLNALHDPAPAVLLPRLLDNAFDWFSSEGFAEMHAVEQAAVVYLRLLDLHPFPALNETTALLTASFYVERAGFPPLIIFSDDITAQRFANVTETAFRMLTQPLVEFFAEMLTRTMRLNALRNRER